MELIEKILCEENLQKAIRKVKKNKGAPGVDKMTVQEVEEWFNQYKEDLISKILNKQYKPMPVKRVYIPKPNGKQRPLGIPTVVDRVIQQAMLQVLSEIYEPVFSEHSYGFRPNRSAHMAMEEVSILRERVNDSKTLHLIRAYLQAGILDKGLVSSSAIGTPQGGPISVILSNIY
uniref:reverse transcriptase domain-containing protein n=1 Tax=Holdemanella biformis TaxID=1735 RepID=UPI0022E52FBD